MFFTEVTAFQQTVATTEWLWVSDTQRKHSLVCKIKQNILLQKTNESLKLLGHMK